MFAYSLSRRVLRNRHDETHKQHTQAAPQRRFRQISKRLVLVYPVTQELIKLRIVIACTLPFELQVAGLHRCFCQRECAFALLCHERLYFLVERHSRTLARHHHQQRVPAVRAEGSCYWRAYIGRQIVPLERRPHSHVSVTNDGEHAEQSNAERSDVPYGPVARKIPRIVLSAPLLFHGIPPVVASARRCRALLNLFWSARSISCCISSAVSVRPCDTAKCMFSRIVRRAKSSARTVCSPALGFVAFSRTSRAHSLIVCSPAKASNWAYSSSVTLVLMDLVRREGMEFTPINSTSSHTGTKSCCAVLYEQWLVASHWIFSKFPYSNLGCCAAPVWG